MRTKHTLGAAQHQHRPHPCCMSTHHIAQISHACATPSMDHHKFLPAGACRLLTHAALCTTMVLEQHTRMRTLGSHMHTAPPVSTLVSLHTLAAFAHSLRAAACAHGSAPIQHPASSTPKRHRCISPPGPARPPCVQLHGRAHTNSTATCTVLHVPNPLSLAPAQLQHVHSAAQH